MIYFITARAIGRVKIGFSEEPRSRFVKMRTDSPVPLELERICEGSQADEAALHERFAEYREMGEWFRLAPAIERHMELLDPPARKKRKALGGPLGKWMRDNGHTVHTIGAMAGVSCGTISRICAGKQTPSFAVLKALVIATKGEVTADDLIWGGPYQHESEAA